MTQGEATAIALQLLMFRDQIGQIRTKFAGADAKSWFEGDIGALLFTASAALTTAADDLRVWQQLDPELEAK